MKIKKGKNAFLAFVLGFGLLFMFFMSPSLAANGNIPPHVDFHWSPETGINTGETIHFYDDSIDDDGTIMAWQWDFDDGEYAIIKNPTHVYSSPGTYDVELTVIDNNGSTNSTSKQVTVINASPTADAGPDQVVNNTLVSFDGTDSSDPDGTIVSYNWNFGDMKTGTGVTTTHNYSDDGVYTATLNVTDNDGASDEDACEITVDTTLPVTNISINGTEGDNDWYTSNVTVTLLPTDATSGIDKTYYLLNNGTWATYTTSITISSEGENIIRFYSIDEAGNEEDVNTNTIKIDKTAPTIIIKDPKQGYCYFFGRSIFPTLRNKTIIIGRITVEVDVTNTSSGIKDVEFYVDEDMKYNTSVSPYVWKWGMAFGRHTLEVKVFDMAGHNTSKEMEVTIFSILPGRNNDVHIQEDVLPDLK